MIHLIVAHGIIKGQLLSCADISESYKIVGACFIYPDAAIGITGMIHSADQTGMQDMAVPADLGGMGRALFQLFLYLALHDELPALEILTGKHALSFAFRSS